MILEFERNDLVEEPTERRLNMDRSIMVFNVKKSEKTVNLNTGNKFNYQNELYEIMNRELIDSPANYVKFNCVLKVTSKAADPGKV